MHSSPNKKCKHRSSKGSLIREIVTNEKAMCKFQNTFHLILQIRQPCISYARYRRMLTWFFVGEYRWLTNALELRKRHTENVRSLILSCNLSCRVLQRKVPNSWECVCWASLTWKNQFIELSIYFAKNITSISRRFSLSKLLTMYAGDIWKLHGNFRMSWWTQSSHWIKTGHRSLGSSQPTVWPHRSANLCPKSSHSLSHRIWKPWKPFKWWVNAVGGGLRHDDIANIDRVAPYVSLPPSFGNTDRGVSGRERRSAVFCPNRRCSVPIQVDRLSRWPRRRSRPPSADPTCAEAIEFLPADSASCEKYKKQRKKK